MKIVITENQLKNIIDRGLTEGLTSVEPSQLLNWFMERSNHTFIFFDTETTGLNRKGGNQLTQIGAIACFFNPETLRFVEIEKFNKHVKLSDDIISRLDADKNIELPDDRNELVKMLNVTKRAVLKYNHYDIEKSATYDDELQVLSDFKKFLDDQGEVILLAHNAPFDLSFIEISELFKDTNIEIFDTLDFFRNIFHPILNRISSSYENAKKISDKFNEKKSGTNSLVNLVRVFTDPSELESKLDMSHEAIQDCRNTMVVFEKSIHMIYNHLSGK